MAITENRNRSYAVCERCHGGVKGRDGFVHGKPGAWKVTHISCIPKYDPDRPWISSLEYDL